MQVSQTTKEDKRENIEDASKKIVDFIYKLLSTSILVRLYNNFAIRAYVNNIVLY